MNTLSGRESTETPSDHRLTSIDPSGRESSKSIQALALAADATTTKTPKKVDP
ncbi:MAG: hypothetical protein KTR30_06910 [Saprospiraceae bacterium]|nr:hypothetical protein [Saprospiraceae bacterium]